jgi:hypothetical protein
VTRGRANASRVREGIPEAVEILVQQLARHRALARVDVDLPNFVLLAHEGEVHVAGPVVVVAELELHDVLHVIGRETLIELLEQDP